ncbi:hypothetical protein EJB05_18530, partial [Eragrostis curvula]
MRWFSPSHGFLAQRSPPFRPGTSPDLHSLVAILLRHQDRRRQLLQIHAQLVAHQVFDQSPAPWRALLKAYSHGPYPQEALHLFRQARWHLADDTFAFAFALKACSGLGWPRAGVQLHGLAVKKGFEFHAYVHTALANVYVVCGRLVEARNAFDEMPVKNVVSWNVMITGFAAWGEVEHARLLFEQMPCRNVVSWTGLIDGYTRACLYGEAVALFCHMMAAGISPSEITVLALVPAISNLGGILMGEMLHGYCEKKGLVADARVGNSLIDLYAKVGSIQNSLKVFHEMLDRRNLVSWTSIISGFAMHGMSFEAVELFADMRRAGIRPNRITFLSVINACSHGGLVEQGLEFFRSMVYEYNMNPEVKHFGCIIDMLGRAGRLCESEQLIKGLPMEVNAVVWRILLGCCSKYGEVEMGERAIKKILELERESGGDFAVLSNMLNELGRFSDAEHARKLVDERKAVKLPGLAFVVSPFLHPVKKHKCHVLASLLSNRLKLHGTVPFSLNTAMMEAIKRLHAHLIVSGLQNCQHAMSKVLRSYALLQPDLAFAYKVIEQIGAPRTFLWSTILRELVLNDAPEDAIAFYKKAYGQGVEPDNLTFPFVLKACARICAMKEGEQMHNHAMKLGFLVDIYVSNSLINLYAACGDLFRARYVFDEMLVKDVVSWNSLICGYSQRNRPKEVLMLFKVMQNEGIKADKVTMVKVVSACSRLGDWGLADSMVRCIEEHGIGVDVYLGNTLIDYYGRSRQLQSAEKVFSHMKDKNIVTLNTMITTYAKDGGLVSARKIFDQIPNKDLISWSSMICGYSQTGHFSEALEIFRQMQRAKMKPDAVVIASVLSACAHLGVLDLGKWIHDYVKRNNIKADVIMENSLIDMYAKCGSAKDALQVFKGMKEKDTLSCNSIIMGLANNGFEDDALNIFHAMLAEGFKPNEVTFLGVLVACANRNLVQEGLDHFESMKSVHNLEPEMKHYGCVVHLLGRAGQLEKALRFVMDMPIAPDPVVWRILLGACKTHGDVPVAEEVTKRLNDLEPGNSGNYTLLSNTDASADRWSDAMNVSRWNYTLLSNTYASAGY